MPPPTSKGMWAMPDAPNNNRWKTLDKDLNRISHMENTTVNVTRLMVAPGIALAFIVVVAVAAVVFFSQTPVSLAVVTAAGFGAYMVLNIRANDVANNMGPAVGAKLINMVGSQITRHNSMRAYCVTLSAALTVIVTSWRGLPVRPPHIAVGGVFGVSFFVNGTLSSVCARPARPGLQRFVSRQKSAATSSWCAAPVS